MTIEKIQLSRGTAAVKIDTFNKRIWITSLEVDGGGYGNELVSKLEPTLQENDLTKVIYPAPLDQVKELKGIGFEPEAAVDGFYEGEGAVFLSRFVTAARQESEFHAKEAEVLAIAKANSQNAVSTDLPAGYEVTEADPDDAAEMAALYSRVFGTYPTPMHRPDYIEKVMEDNVDFKVVRCDGEIVSAASADINPDYAHAEITDCATDPGHRKLGLTTTAICQLEESLKDKGVMTAFSIARAGSIGMNTIFAKMGYRFTGKLVNNCYIAGRFENMNVWVKNIG